jgi:CRISPR type III-A-associated RAMP protein Csm4
MTPDFLIRLNPTGPLRIGPDSGDRDRVDRIYHSDTLYSAITSAMARLGWLEEWLEDTARAAQPAVRFSSCFPFIAGTLFVVPPRSLWPPPASARVRWKGARFVPISVVETLAAGQTLSEENWTVDGASECLTPIGSQGPFRVAVRSSAAVDRQGMAVDPHSSACLEFAPNAGLWTLAAFAHDAARERWENRLRGALRFMGDSGIGGERSRGWGRAEVEIATPAGFFPTPDPSAEAAWWMLSMFHPSDADVIDWQRGNYALQTRGGRVESGAGWGESKKPARMVVEGSVLVSATEPRGSAADVAPEGFPHPVYRAGFALAIPIPLRIS